MKNAVEMGSDAIIYIPSFIEIVSAIQKRMGGNTQHKNRISLLYFFFQNKERRLKRYLSNINTKN
jgi:hypothetical protein